MRTPEQRELSRLQAQNARLRVMEGRYRRGRREAARQAPPRPQAQPPAPFAISDPRQAPRAGERVLPPLTAPLRLGRRLAAELRAELRAMAVEARALVRALQGAPEAAEQLGTAMDALPDEAQQRLDALGRRWAGRFAALAERWSRGMVAQVTRQSTAQLAHGLRDAAQFFEVQATLASPRVRAVLEAGAASSVGLITRIPERFLGAVQTAVMTAMTTGSGLEQLVPYLERKYRGDARHAQLVALDQVRKVSANVNAARLQSLGVEEYVWVHVAGERYPRKLHQSYSGRTFRYDDPPIIDRKTGERGKPGDAINCRCQARPIIRWSKLESAA